MTTTDYYLPRLKKSFSRCISGPMDTIRCERLHGDRTHSVYFFKAASSLPDPPALERLHQEIVSPSYFASSDAARWNHYLVFVVGDDQRNNGDLARRRLDIETDKNYARKSVVFESELESFVDRSLDVATPDNIGHSIVNTWSAKLAEAGLSQIQIDLPRAPIVKALREGKLVKEAPRTQTSFSNEFEEVGMLREINISKFGDRRIRGTFKFARVTLVRGSNGTGKTSLLEAIEHYFCGATYRAQGRSVELEATAYYLDNRAPLPYVLRSNAAYQERDHHWYSRLVNKGNKLFEGFSRFNFLNTDAAVDFAKEASLRDLGVALSTVALGPDASFTWRRIKEFDEHISGELRPVLVQLERLHEDVESGRARLLALQAASPKVDALKSEAVDALTRLAWPIVNADRSEALMFVDFQPLGEFGKLYAAAGHPSTRDELELSCSALEADLATIRDKLSELDELSKSETEIIRLNQLNGSRIDTLRRFEQYIESGFAELCDLENSLQRRSTELLRNLIAHADLNELRTIGKGYLGLQYEELEKYLADELSAARNSLERAERKRAEAEKQSHIVETLKSDLRTFGLRYAHENPKGGECPLCHSAMDMTDLVRRIESVVQKQEGVNELGELGVVISGLARRIEDLTRASLIAGRLRDVTSEIYQGTVLHRLENLQLKERELGNLIERDKQTKNQLTVLRAAGFNPDEYFQVKGAMQADESLQDLVERPSQSAIRQRLTDLSARSNELNESIGQLKRLKAEAEEKKAQASERHASHDVSAGKIEDEMASNLRALQSLKENISAFPVETLLAHADLASFAEKVIQAQRSLDSLSEQMNLEASRNSELAIVQAKLSRDSTIYRETAQERDRLSLALDVLRDLENNFSLEDNLSQFLAKNLVSIQRIFSKIHVPRELRISSLADCGLHREGVQGRVELNEVSTGQRAALMLSVFFALNLSLKSGPPLMLIDDPIAHIDDLNALSFLDFLADVAASGRRQIFFATANEKLANLFEKKMEFLGGDFQTIDMQIVER